MNMKKWFLFLCAAACSLHAFDSGEWTMTGKPEKITSADGVCRIQLPPGPAANTSSLEIDDGRAIVQRPRPRLILTRRLPVQPETVYLLQLQVKSSNSVVMVCGERRMAYSLPGRPQLLCDLVKSGKGKELEVKIELGGLPGESVYELSEFELRKPDLAEKVPVRPSFARTVLDANTVIVHPAGFEDTAAKVQRVIREKTGLNLKTMPDDKAVYPDRPVVLDELKKHHLILLGRLDNNRAMWGAYNKFLAAADGYYPGAGGYVVRTASNVYGNGANHIILGGSDDAGIRRAADEFAGMIESAEIPFLLKVELGGDCRKAFDADERRWAANPASAGPKLLEPGYGKVVRWYVNVMNYYWSGRESYKQRSREYLTEILKDQAYTHHYIVEFFVRAYDMVDHSDLFTPEERSRLDALLKKNFMEFLTGPDLTWMMLFNRPYELLVVMNRHNIAPWMADLTLGDFLAGNVPLTGDEAAVVRYRREEKHEFMKYWTANTFNVSLPRNLYGASEEEVIASMFRYALANEEYGLFNSANARQALRLWEMSPVRPRLYDDRLIAGMLACYYRDPGFVWLYRQMPSVREHFQMRYVNGVHRYAPGDALPAREPLQWAGVQKTAVQPQDRVLWNALKYKQHRTPDFPASEGAEKISFRGGFKPTDDFLKISGLGDDAGSIMEFYSYGKPLLMRSSSSTFGAGRANYYDYNALTVQRLDKWTDDPQPYAGAVRLESLENGGDRGSATFSLKPFAGCEWQRSIVWLKRGLFLVRDRITALEDGEYLIQIGWRPQGIPKFDGRTWTGANGKVNFHLTSLGENFSVKENLSEYDRRIAEFPKYHHTARVKLAKGESVSACTLLEAAPSSRKPTPFELGRDRTVKAGDTVLRFDDDGRPPEFSAEGFTPLPLSVTQTDAAKEQEPACVETGRNTILQMPGKLHSTARGNTVDFGKVVQLSEIRHAYRSRIWTKQPLPDNLEYSEDGKTFHKITSPKHWLPGVKTANYGQADPQAESHQYTRPEVKARYVRGANAAQYSYYSSDIPDRRSNLELIPAGDGFLAQSNIYPRYIRDRRGEDYLFAMFDRDFKLKYTYRAPGVVQDSKIIAWPDRTPRLCIVTEDAKIRFLGDDGQVVRTIDLYQLQHEFHRKYGKPNTRQPLGGFTLPFSIGVWQADAGAEPLLAVGRYCYYSFIKPDGSLDGVLAAQEYSINSLLDRGIDPNGDGKTEIYGLGRYNLTRVSGPADRRTDNGCPQVYRQENYRLPAYGGGIEGDRMLCFKVAGGSRLAVARESFLAFFDTGSGKWLFTWAAPVSLTAVEQIGPREFLAASTDNVLRRLTFKPGFEGVEKFDSIPVRRKIRNIRHYNGKTYLTTADGLFEYRDGSLKLLFEGNCRDMAANPDGKLLILSENGELITCREK